ncbi:ABC transporter permease [Maledivibacter halophilus]|uniref:Peptide/nickel transport system permease protein n=1 Tax=Maledivibacter halophilus TaxID=36842 RepID=A0A1T5JS82_9FIRM|nr:ABC transporter permease [Maledivibacter halophilus]SKC54260.1 peptide/nickel transport system permease protein [Maledivibacter halophilus]
MELKSRKKLIFSIALSALIILTIIILSCLLTGTNVTTNVAEKSLAPNARHLFGTDSLGRDMLSRTVKGLRFSMLVGLIGSFTGAIIAVIMGVMAATAGKKIDSLILWLIDLFISMPHLIFLILISFAVGRGAKGVVIGVALTHWPTLARLVRNEVYNIKNMEYIKISENFGKSKLFIVSRHILPAVLPQVMVGLLLLFPHAILHEASMTFLGFGLSAQTSSIGIILSEAVKYISLGDWWLVVFPGALLVIVVKSFDSIGESLRVLFDPQTSYM